MKDADEIKVLTRQLGHLMEFVMWLRNDYYKADWELHMKLETLLTDLAESEIKKT